MYYLQLIIQASPLNAEQFISTWASPLYINSKECSIKMNQFVFYQIPSMDFMFFRG